MNASDRDLLLTLVKGAPGPAPWYVRGKDPGVTAGGRKLAWMEADSEGPLQGFYCLDDEGRALIFVRMYTIVGPVEGNRLLVAFKRKQPDVLAVHLFNVDELTAVDDPVAVCKLMDHPDQPYCSAAEPAAQVVIPRRVGAGIHPFKFPPAFHGIGETALVSSMVRPGHPATEARSTAIYILRPEIEKIEVIPQTWFNEGEYQHGFQWITRAARDPFSDRIVGEGFRLGYFLLNEAGDQVDEWLEQSKTHMP